VALPSQVAKFASPVQALIVPFVEAVVVANAPSPFGHRP
jgi:hypothetical protein